jgi:hypothetical protein
MRLVTGLFAVLIVVLSASVAIPAVDEVAALDAAGDALERAILMGGDDIVPKAALAAAEVEDVLFVHHPETLETAFGLAIIRSAEGRVIGLIGIDAEDGKALWYRFNMNEENFPPVSRQEAETAIRNHVQEAALAEDIGQGMLVMGHDKHLYWRFENPQGGAWLLNGERPGSEVIDAGDQRIGDSGCCEGRQRPSVEAEKKMENLGAETRAPHAILGARPPAYNISGIPYHYQITDWYCCLASLQMIFSYYGEEIGQDDLGDVANDVPGVGCYHDGIFRAGLFSGMSTAIQNPSLEGYVERQLGYASSDYWFGYMGSDALRLELLKTLIYEHCPILVSTWYSGPGSGGHCRVVKGYDDNLGVIVIHDPWYSGVLSGPNMLIDQATFVYWWVDWSYGESFFFSPWILTPELPSTVAGGDTFTVSLTVKYPGPPPYNGNYPAYTCSAGISLPSGLSLAGSSSPVGFADLYTDDSTVVSWDVVADGPPGEYGIAFYSQGLVDDPYQAYTDSIGGHAYETVEVTGGLVADWDAEERLTGDAAESHTCFPGGRAMVMEDDGTVHLVWEDTRDGDSEIYYRRRSGGVWGAETRLTTSAGLSWSPCIAQGPDGHLHVAWVDSRDGNHEIYYKTWDPEGGWSADERVTTYGEVDYNPSIAVGDTAVYVVWELRLSGGDMRKHAVAFKERTALGWGPTTDMDASVNRDSFRPSIAYGADGKLHAVYERSTSYPTDEHEKIVYKSWDGLTWSGRTGLSTDLSFSRNPVIAAGPGSSLHVVWQDGENTGGDIFYIAFDGAAWQPVEEIVTGGTEAETPSVSVDGSGKVSVAWSDNRNGQAEIYYKSKSGTVWSDDVRLSAAPGMSITPAVESNPSGSSCVVWTDYRHGDSDLYFRCTSDESGVPQVSGEVPVDAFVHLSEPYPVPFGTEVRFNVYVKEPSHVSIGVFDVMGRSVRTLADRVFVSGRHQATWDGRDDDGRPAAPGIYFVFCEAPEGTSARRVVLVR